MDIAVEAADAQDQSIEQFKVQWKHFGPKEATWDMTNQMQAMHPSLFTGGGKAVLV